MLLKAARLTFQEAPSKPILDASLGIDGCGEVFSRRKNHVRNKYRDNYRLGNSVEYNNVAFALFLFSGQLPVVNLSRLPAEVLQYTCVRSEGDRKLMGREPEERRLAGAFSHLRYEIRSFFHGLCMFNTDGLCVHISVYTT